MPITFVSSAVNGGNGTSITLAEPSGLQSGDVVYALCITTGNSSGFSTVPSGFTQLASSGTGGGTTSADGQCFLYRAVRGGSAFTSTWGTGSNLYTEVLLVAYRGVDTTTPEHAATYDAAITQQSNLNPPAVTTSINGTVILTGGMAWEGATTTFGAPSGYTMRANAFAPGADGMMADKAGVNGSNDPASFSGAAASNDSWGFTIALNPIPDAVQTQSHARFRNDDGSETTATWAAAQDTNVTAPTGANLRVRVLVDATGDPASSPYALYVSKNGGAYGPVPVGASAVYGTVTFGAIGTGANGSTSVAPSYPTGITAGDYLTCHVSSGATNSETPSTPAGWTLLATGASTDGSFGVDTGPRRMTVFGKIADGTESGTLTVSITNGNTCRGSIIRWSKTDPNSTWVIDAQGGDDSTSGTGFSVTFASQNWNTGDATVVSVGQRVDTVTQSSQSLTASGVTFGSRTNRASTAVTTGNDHRHVIDTFDAVTGTSNVDAAATWAYTGSAACSGGAVIVRLREYTPAGDVYVATSSNITAGGEATTAQLTAPSGKSTSDFVTGRMWDDENGSDSIDITTDDYTEFEWCLQAQSPATNGDEYEFRVYLGAVALDTYSVTPKWTIGSGGGTTFTQSVGGGLTPSGALLKAAAKALASASTPAGVVVKQTTKQPFASATTPAGSVTRQTQKGLASSTAPSGALATLKLALLSLGGALTPAGAVLKQVGKLLASATASAGSLLKQTAKALASSTGPTGTLSRTTSKTLGSATTPSGTLAALKIALLSLGGAVTPSGTLQKLVGKLLGSATAPAGSLVKQDQKALGSSTAPTGELTRQTNKGLGGGLTPSGVLSALKIALKSVSGALTPSGALQRTTAKGLGSSTTPTGALARAVAKGLGGALGPSGVLVRLVGKLLGSATTPTGVVDPQRLAGTFTKSLAGAVASSGALLRQTQKGLAASVAPTGALRRAVSKSLGGVVAPVGAIRKFWGIRLFGSVTPSGVATPQTLGTFSPANFGRSKPVTPVLTAAPTTPALTCVPMTPATGEETNNMGARDFTVGRTAAITEQLYADGQPFDASGMTIELELTDKDGAAIPTAGNVSWSNAATSLAQYVPDAGDFATPGVVNYKFKVTDGAGKVRHYPEGRSNQWTIWK